MEIPKDLYELYAEFGIAAEKAQVLEVEAGNVGLAFLSVFVDTDQITDEERARFRGLVDDANRKTLGALLKVVKSLGTLDQSILDAIDEALERRNYLMHKFFRHHNFAICSEAGRKTMIDELREIQRKLALAHAMLHGISSTLAALAGRPAASEELAAQFLNEGERVDI